MALRALYILAAAWSLALVPALCSGGMLAHACGCVETACDYQGACGPDPCDQVFSSNGHDKPELGTITAVQPSVQTPSVINDGAGPTPIRTLYRLPSPHLLPCFVSDLPLLN